MQTYDPAEQGSIGDLDLDLELNNSRWPKDWSIAWGEWPPLSADFGLVARIRNVRLDELSINFSAAPQWSQGRNLDVFRGNVGFSARVTPNITIRGFMFLVGHIKLWTWIHGMDKRKTINWGVNQNTLQPKKLCTHNRLALYWKSLRRELRVRLRESFLARDGCDGRVCTHFPDSGKLYGWKES